MDKTLRNTIITVIIAMIPVILSMITAWVNLNSRLSVVEMQVRLFINSQQKSDEQIKKISDDISEIKLQVNTLFVKFNVSSNDGISNIKK